MRKRNWYLWVVAIIITISAAYYQRITGPTYPKKIKFSIAEQEEEFTFIRSHGGDKDCQLAFPINDPIAQGTVFYKRYPTSNDWSSIALNRRNDTLFAALPVQPPAGKLIYYVELRTGAGKIHVSKDNPIIIRFKGDVPSYVLIPHVLLIFLAMLISNLAGLMAIGKRSRYRFYGMLAFLLLLVGGMIMGPVMQKFAFGEFWTGVPFGWDLTDNKTLIAFVFWLFAILVNRKKDRPYAIIMAAVVTLIIFTIPHSLFGSELNYSSGVISQG